MEYSRDFQQRQIVYLEHQASRLYTEVIQVIELRQMCWVRPLFLVEFSPSDTSAGEPILYDLRPSADLLWSLNLFKPALDTEVMPFLMQLLSLEIQSDCDSIAHQYLHQFIHKFWLAHKKS